MGSSRERVISIAAITFFVLFAILQTANTPAMAAPLRASIGVSPSSGAPGLVVTVSGSGFTPGGYQGTLFWDGTFQKSFDIPSGGNFSTGFTIPGGASAGNHTIQVCASSGGTCFTGEFAQQATAIFNVVILGVTPIPPTPVPTFNVQPAGIEVTQGIRQGIPSRTSTGDLVLRPEDWIHVAGRRTIVRVYPLLVNGPTTQVAALLYGQRDGVELPGSPLTPERRYVVPRSGASIEDMRRDIAQSWIFVLPESWTEEGSIYLTASVNPAGLDRVAECPGCDDDNTAYLGGVRFERIQERSIRIQIIRTNWFWRDASGAIVNDMAELSEIFNMLLFWEKTWPVDESLVRLLPIRQFNISHGDAEPPIADPPNWDNQVFHDVFGHLYAPPQGRNDRPAFSSDPYIYVPTVFDPDSAIIGCSGVAGIGYPPLFHTGACWAAAQEAGHSIGLNHASNAHGELGGGPVDPAFPGAHGQIEPDAFGFDIFSLQVIPPDSSCEGHTHDFMSYGCATKWVSVYTWNKLMQAFRTENALAYLGTPGGTGIQLVGNLRQQAPAAMRIGGEIRADGSMSLSPIMRLDANLSQYDEPESEYRLVVRDARGEELYSRRFTPLMQTHSEEGGFVFYELIPVLSGAAVIEFEHDGVLIGSLAASAHPPTVQLTGPASGSTWEAGSEFTVSWTGEDPDGDTVYYRVELQREGEQAWTPIYGDTTQNQVVLDASLLPGYGEGWKLRVQASDGFHSATDEVGSIAIMPQPPQVFILQPVAGRIYSSGAALDLMGQAADLEQGLLSEESLTWFLDGEQVGSGVSLRLAAVAEGTHEVKLAAVSAAGLTAEAVISLKVDRDSDSDGMTNGWEESYGLAPLNPSDAAMDNDGDDLTNGVEFVIGSDPTKADSDGDGFSDEQEYAEGTDPSDPTSFSGHQHGPINPGGSIHAGDEHRLSAEGQVYEPAVVNDEEPKIQPEQTPSVEEPGEIPGRTASVLVVAVAAVVVVGGLVAGIVWLRRRSS